MGDFLLVQGSQGGREVAVRSGVLRDLAQDHGFVVTDLNKGAWLGVRGPNAPKRLQVGAWTLIGDVFNRRSPDLPPDRPADPWNDERQLLAQVWGRYVGVRFSAGFEPSALLRDPSGAMECVTWSQDGLTFVASSAEEWLISNERPPWRLNVDRIAQALHGLVAATGLLMIDGPTALEPGAVQPLPLPQRAVPLWTPRDHALRSLAPAPSALEAEARLRSAIEEAVDGLSDSDIALAGEISGGLDSSIVAAVLSRRGPRAVRIWLNAYATTPESDERLYVAALGRALSISPVSVSHASKPMTPERIAAISAGFRPGLNAIDGAQDEAWAHRIEEAGAQAVMTGKGGDAILLQAATADVFTDLWRRRGVRALLWPDLGELAASNEVSIWTLVQKARRHGQGATHSLVRDHPMLKPLMQAPQPHPWLENLQIFGPAKIFQIAGVADSVSHHGASLLTRSIDARHPLCAQPVIETCLSLPASSLALGGRDRGLARRAFADRLPDLILNRRSKGEMTRVYGRMIVDNLDFIRPWLIEGRLAGLGLIDRAAADIELTPEALIWSGHYAVILTAVAVEAWVRTWEGRLGPVTR